MTPADLIDRKVSFDKPGTVPPVRLVGVVTEAKDNGLTQRGAIPDLLVTVKGASGAVMTISFVDSYCRIQD